MITDYKSLKRSIAQSVADALKALNPPTLPTPKELADLFEYPPEPKLGDLALPCFKLAKTMRKAPPLIANTIAACGNSDRIIIMAGNETVFAKQMSTPDLTNVVQ